MWFYLYNLTFIVTQLLLSTVLLSLYLIQGYKQRDAFIITQAPLVNTIVDFWTLIHDQSCRTVVMMNEQDSADKVKHSWCISIDIAFK